MTLSTPTSMWARYVRRDSIRLILRWTFKRTDRRSPSPVIRFAASFPLLRSGSVADGRKAREARAAPSLDSANPYRPRGCHDWSSRGPWRARLGVRSSQPPSVGALRRVPLVRTAAAPLHPPGIVHRRVRVGHADSLEEHHQIMVGMGQTQNLVAAIATHTHLPAAQRRRPVHNDRSTIHDTSLPPHRAQGQPRYPDRSGRQAGPGPVAPALTTPVRNRWLGKPYRLTGLPRAAR